MIDLHYGLARISATIVFSLLRFLKFGGTALPGLIATTIDPQFVAKSLNHMPVILVAGTNGKTTTANLLRECFPSGTVVANSSGSNMLRGIASSFIEMGRHHKKLGIFEVDEADLPEVSRQLHPKAIVLLNLFRDQMDRYGEITKTFTLWKQCLSELPETTTVFVNADDPLLAWLGREHKQVRYFGINDSSVAQKEGATREVADSIISPLTNEKLHYEAIFYSHLGIYRDLKSEFQRPKLDIAIENISLSGVEGSHFSLVDNGENKKFETKLPGLFNIYNAAAACIGAQQLRASDEAIVQAVRDFTGAFGRFEKIKLANNKTLILFLAKNPVSFNQIISLLNATPDKKELLIGINNNFADGKDISWLWDTNTESLAYVTKHVITTGLRAHEMALRLKYTGIPQESISSQSDMNQALNSIQNNDTGSSIIYGLVTYTAMLELRDILRQKKLVKKFHES